MKRPLQAISIIIPTLNEADNLPLLLLRIHRSLSHAEIPYEIIVVDDHSIDDTAALARNAHPKYHARLLTKQGKPGKAYSLLEGFAAAKYDLVCMIDADLQYPPEAIKLMYHKLQYCEADIVLTERVNNKTSWVRRLFSYTFNLLFTRLLFGINYDTQSGLKLFRKNVLRTITIEPTPWTFDLEFIVRALEQNYSIVSQQIPFSKRHAGVPQLHILSATYEIALSSLKLWRRSSSKQVKTSHKNSELLQRSMHWLFAFITASILLTGIIGPNVSAVDANEGIPKVTASKVLDKAKDALTDDPSNTGIPPVTTSASSAIASPTATSTPTSASATPTASDALATPTTSGTKATVKPIASAKTAAGATVAASPVVTPTSRATATTKDAAYYPVSKLSSNKTQELAHIALIVVGLGVSFISIALLIISLKARLAARVRRQQAISI